MDCRIKTFFSLSFSTFLNWILVLCCRLRSWNFSFFPYTGFCVRGMKDMCRVHRFLNNQHGILNCTYWLILKSPILHPIREDKCCHIILRAKYNQVPPPPHISSEQKRLNYKTERRHLCMVLVQNRMTKKLKLVPIHFGFP